MRLRAICIICKLPSNSVVEIFATNIGKLGFEINYPV
jgi:hypothetical protein